MAETLSQQVVEAAKPRGRPYDIRDARLKGFLLRVTPKGDRAYYVNYARGKRYRIGSAEVLTPKQARAKAKAVLGAYAESGEDPNQSRRRSRAGTLRDFIEHEYAPWCRANRKAAESTLARLEACFDEEFGNCRLDELTPSRIEPWRTERLRAGRSPATVQRDITVLKAALNKAVRWKFIEVNPLADLEHVKTEDEDRVRYLSKEEGDHLMAALDHRERNLKAGRHRANEWRAARGYPLLPELDELPFADYLKPMTLLALNTGMRRGELFQLTWPDVDFSARVLTVRASTAKGAKARRIPMNDRVCQVLTNWRRVVGTDTGLVFRGKEGRPMNNIKKAWANLMKAAHIEGFRFHDCRHDFASRLVMAGVDLYTVKELLGHSTIRMTERYAHLAPEHKAQAVAMLNPASNEGAQ